MPKVPGDRIKGICPVCGEKVSGSGRIYCAGCQPPIITGDGYVKIYKPEHPQADKAGYVLEHYVVMEEKLGRPVKDKEVVHHIDGNRGNNTKDNLMLFPTSGEHIKHHAALRRREALIELLSITPTQWATAWLKEHDERLEYLRSLGLSNGQALKRALTILGMADVHYITYNLPGVFWFGEADEKPPEIEARERNERQRLAKLFETEFVEYAMAQATKLR